MKKESWKEGRRDEEAGKWKQGAGSREEGSREIES